MPNYPQVTINKNDKFFVALCVRYDLTPFRHTFISLGVENKDGEKVMLGAFGKNLASNFSYFECLTTGSSKAKIYNERIFFNEDNQENSLPLTYKAYELTYEQYLEFLEYLATISNTQSNLSRLEAYTPVENDPTEEANKVTFKWQYLGMPTEKNTDENNNNANENSNKESIKKAGYTSLGLTNTCRHSAISLIKKAGSLTTPGAGIFSFFMRSPPLTATTQCFKLGRPEEHIYLLPLAPSSYLKIPALQRTILTKLYERLEQIVLTKQNAPTTKEKFEKIKKLYDSLIKNQEVSLGKMFEEINKWVDQNNTLIKTHRKSHWISFKTSTENMFQQIKALKSEDNEEPATTLSCGT